MSDRPKADFEESGAVLASSTEPQTSQNLKFERSDWVAFRTVEGLHQKAGVSKDKLRRLVLKELADNGLDDGGAVRIGQFSPAGFVGDGYIIESDGHGIDGTPEEIARLFSIARPMVSTKLLRLPTRGALGNGLRVVAGSVLASGGSLAVTSRNRRIVLRPEHDGTPASSAWKRAAEARCVMEGCRSRRDIPCPEFSDPLVPSRDPRPRNR
jgi:hypothetical protein